MYAGHDSYLLRQAPKRMGSLEILRMTLSNQRSGSSCISKAAPLESQPKRYLTFGLLACRAFITVSATFSGLRLCWCILNAHCEKASIASPYRAWPIGSSSVKNLVTLSRILLLAGVAIPPGSIIDTFIPKGCNSRLRQSLTASKAIFDEAMAP